MTTAEEVEDASLVVVVPQCMWWSYILNAFRGIVILIPMLFCIQNFNDAINYPVPYVGLLKNTRSVGVTMTLTVILFLLFSLGIIKALTTTSREAWAFSRDQGFPFSKWISRVSSMNSQRYIIETFDNETRWTTSATSPTNPFTSPLLEPVSSASLTSTPRPRSTSLSRSSYSLFFQRT